MIIVTGGAGFIGSNIVRSLNEHGYENILIVDNLTDGKKFFNIADLTIIDYQDKREFIADLLAGKSPGNIEAVFHQGACSDTTQWDGRYMMENNYQYSKNMLHFCLERKIPFLYASSAAVYGYRDNHFIEERQYEKPINMYAYSKFLFDQYVRTLLPAIDSPVCGFRYFNVYGPRESHKGSMASVAFHLHNQVKRGEAPKLFAGSENFKRDFVHVDDVTAVNLWCWQKGISGIFNCGTGYAESFQTVADTVIHYHNSLPVEYIPFPDKLKGCYQAYTQADLTRLRSTGYNSPFKSVAQGVREYLAWLDKTR